MKQPDLLWLYRSAGAYRWIRRDPAGHITARSSIGHSTKTAMWRSCRRLNPTHEHCRVDDRTFTWTRAGPADLSRPPLPEHQRTLRQHLPMKELRRRL